VTDYAVPKIDRGTKEEAMTERGLLVADALLLIDSEDGWVLDVLVEDESVDAC